MNDMRTPQWGIGPPGDSEVLGLTIEDSHRYAMWDAAYVLGSLSAVDRREFEAHMSACPACREDVAQLSGVPALLCGECGTGTRGCHGVPASFSSRLGLVSVHPGTSIPSRGDQGVWTLPRRLCTLLSARPAQHAHVEGRAARRKAAGGCPTWALNWRVKKKTSW